MKKPETYIKGETFYHTFLRFLSFHFITKILWNTNITPNQITVFRNILLVISFYLFLKFDYWYILGFVLFQVSEFLDSVDGDLARYKNLKSKMGIWLEIFFDAILTPVWGVIGLLFAYFSYKISGDNWIYFVLWGLIGFSVNMEQSFYMNFRGNKDGMQEAKHGHIYFGFKGESLLIKLRNFIIVSKSWENQWLVFAGLIYVVFKIDIFLYIWIWLLLLNQIHWIRLAYFGYKKGING